MGEGYKVIHTSLYTRPRGRPRTRLHSHRPRICSPQDFTILVITMFVAVVTSRLDLDLCTEHRRHLVLPFIRGTNINPQ